MTRYKIQAVSRLFKMYYTARLFQRRRSVSTATKNGDHRLSKINVFAEERFRDVTIVVNLFEK